MAGKLGNRKVVLITGAKQGIGYQTSLQLAHRNWKVIMADNQDLSDAKERIVKATLNRTVSANTLDLSSERSIKKFVTWMNSNEEHLDVLINNAGLFTTGNGADNLEKLLYVNHLGPFLLTYLLTDLLKKCSPSRIIFLSSSGAFFNDLNPDLNPNAPYFGLTKESLKCFGVLKTYYNTKALNMLISKEFSRRLQQCNVTSNCLHPGMTNTSFLVRNCDMSYLAKVIFQNLVNFTTQDVSEAAKNVVFMTTSPTLTHVSGKYFANYQERRQPRILDDDEFSRRIWQQCELFFALSN
ncbi:retinol dehydrogenase 13-like [Cylas formicarius]|uniref:retinol dehydrogenase 13-like n=1 Tax=Cylas formicarius TaxID=197179 RepID=UPI0029585D50|nr:retinol dehydrogenase 13-like [Cylas formicarius]